MAQRIKKSPGQAAYETWCLHLQPKQTSIDWFDLPLDTQIRWNTIADKAIRQHVINVMESI